MAKKWVYLFSEGNKDMRDLLGGKGAGLAEMTNAACPSPGFTITTEACIAYYAAGNKFPEGMWDQALEAHEGDRAADGQEVWRSEEPAAGLGALRRARCRCPA